MNTRNDAPYVADVKRICDVVDLSGAAEQATNQADRNYLIASYLGKNLETSDAQRWLVSIKPLKGAAMADALEQEARRVGVPSCALATEWRSKPSP